MLERIRENCRLCIEYAKSPSRKKATFMKALDFNACVSLDLKELTRWGKHILYMCDEFSRLTKGVIINDKRAETIVQAFNQEWVIGHGLGPGLPLKVHADNGKEFDNDVLKEFLSRLGINMTFSAFYSPEQNGVNERNHHTVDILFFKIMSDNPDMKLQDALDLACYSKNIEINRTGFSSLQIVYGKNPRIISNFEPTTMTMDVCSDSELVRKLINRMENVRMEYRKLEVDKKIRLMLSERIQKWNDYVLEVNQQVWFKFRKEFWRKGKIVAIEGQVIHILSDGSVLKIPRCNVRPDNTEQAESMKRSETRLETIMEEQDEERKKLRKSKTRLDTIMEEQEGN